MLEPHRRGRGIDGDRHRRAVVAGEQLQVAERRVRHAHRDALGLQRRLELAQRHALELARVVVEDEAVVAVCVHALVARLRADAGDLRQRLVQHDGVGVADPVLLRKARQLGLQHGALPLRHAHVRAGRAVVVEPLAALAAAVVVSHGGFEIAVVGQQHATLAGRHQLELCIENDPKAPHEPTPSSAPRRAVGMRAVLDQVQVPALTQRGQRVEIGHAAAAMHRHDRLRARREGGLGRRGVDAQRVGVDIDDHRRGPGRHDRRRGRDERDRRHEHLVAGADAEGDERGLDGVRAVRHRQAVAWRPGRRRSRPRSAARGRRRPTTTRPTRASRSGAPARCRPTWATTGRDVSAAAGRRGSRGLPWRQLRSAAGATRCRARRGAGPGARAPGRRRPRRRAACRPRGCTRRARPRCPARGRRAGRRSSRPTRRRPR